MRLKYVLLILFLFEISFELVSQPLAPRNRARKKPLMEIFSGVRCPWCIQGDLILNSYYGCPYSIINYHSGIFAIPKDTISPDLRTTCGDIIHDSLGISSYPFGYLNRTNGGNSNTWNSLIGSYEIANVNIGMEVKYDPITSSEKVRVEVFPFAEYKDSLIFLQVFLTESNILASQLDFDGNCIMNYHHDNVFRFPISACLGDTLQPIRTRLPFEKSYTFAMPNYVFLENAKIVAFITDRNGKVLNSETIRCLGGKTDVPLVMYDEQDRDVVFDPFTPFSDSLYFISYSEKPIPLCIILDQSRPNWKASISYLNQEDSLLNLVIKPHDTILIVFNLKSIDQLQFGKINIRAFINCKADQCGLIFEKKYFFHHRKKALVIINTSASRFSGSSHVDLASPVTEVLDNFICDNYAVEEDTTFEEIYQFRKRQNIKTQAIYYSAGTGIKIMTDSSVVYLKSLIDSGTNLFLHGQDIAFQLIKHDNPKGANNWLSNYGIAFVNDGDTSVKSINIETRDSIFGKVGSSTIKSTYASGIKSNLSVDAITGDPQIIPRVMFNNKRYLSGTYRDLGISKIVLFCVGMEMIENDTFRFNFITRIHRWFNACNSLVNVQDPVAKTNLLKCNLSADSQNIYLSTDTDYYPNRLVIYNLLGQKLEEHHISQNEAKIAIQHRINNSGIYIIQLLSDQPNIHFYSVKLFISK